MVSLWRRCLLCRWRRSTPASSATGRPRKARTSVSQGIKSYKQGITMPPASTPVVCTWLSILLGRDIKYSCEVGGCTIKRKMGYKEFCIHMSNEHRGILDILRDDGRPELLEVADLLDNQD